MINDKASLLIDQYAQTNSLGWAAGVEGNLEYEMEEGKIKSPIEQMFYVAWQYGCEGNDDCTLDAQHKVGKFKCDFSVMLLDHFVNHEYRFTLKELEQLDKELPKIVIELDGHQWHEKHASQVEKDKQRERFIVSQGYKVYRFSGWEVFRNPLDCVSEVRDQVREIIRLAKKKAWGR